MVVPHPLAIRRELAKRRLHHFVREAWHVVEPQRELVWGQHIEAICLHLEAVTRQQLWEPGKPEPDSRIQELIINIPPGLMKSLLVSVLWPAWEWIGSPHLQTLFSSYALSLAIRDSQRRRDLIKSEWYQEWFKPAWRLKGDQDTKGWFANTAGGKMQCVSVGSQVTGFRGHKNVYDDLLNATQAHSDAVRTAANEWLKGTMSTRFLDPRTGAQVLIMQRLHEEDATGAVLPLGWEHLCLPSEFDSKARCRTSLGWEDWRTEDGELLFPDFQTPEVLAKQKLVMGSANYSAQFNQNPTPAGGLIFKAVWWRYWQWPGQNLPPVRLRDENGDLVEIHPVDLPVAFDECLQSWDFAFKDKKDSDHVAGGLWKRKGSQVFLLDRLNDQLDFTKSVQAIRTMKAQWPETQAILIEDKANGPAIINTLETEIPGIIAVEPDGGKKARAYAVTPYVEAGNVFLPHPMIHAWSDEIRDELTKFPLAAHDDDVDQTTQALRRFFGGPEAYVHASEPDAPGARASLMSEPGRDEFDPFSQPF
jgi:predicted phage terminase large subunit-like protein